MKGIILLLSLCFAVSVYAGNEGSTQKCSSIEKRTIEKKIQKLQAPQSLADRMLPATSNSSRVKAASKAKMAENKKQDVTNGWLDFGNVRNYTPQNVDSKERLDSIVMANNTGETISLQYFQFDEHQWTVKRTNSLWTSKTESWEPFEEYGFIWDKDGYLLEQTGINIAYNEGMKEEFTYNDQKLGISKVRSNMIDGEWYYAEKGEYKYDDNANIIEEVVYTYNKDKKDWEKTAKAYATYNKNHRQTGFEAYNWDGNDWIGDNKAVYEYDENDSITLYAFYQWQPETKDWLYFHKFEQVFEEGKIMQQQESFWNKADKTWLGLEEYNGAILYTGKTDFEYDEQGREIYQIFTRFEENGWKKKVDMTGTWTTLENGQNQVIRKTYFYAEDNNTDKYINQELTKRFNGTSGNIEYAFEKFIDGDQEQYLYEEIYEYDNEDYLLGSKYWWYEEATNKKFADISEKYTYDANHHIIEATYTMGQGSAEDDWVNVSQFKYTYENNVPTEKLAYRWENDDWATNWGNGAELDFSVLSSDMYTPIGYNDEHKILATYDYTGTGTDWDYNKYVYYYSDQKVVTGIQSASDITFSVYPNPVVDILYIQSTENTDTNLYNLQGAKLLNTTEKRIDMSAYPTGLYVIEINGTRAKVLKK